MTTNKELIEKYFDKILTEKEKILFKEKYDTEAAFREELKQQALIITVLKSKEIEYPIEVDVRKKGEKRQLIPLLTTIAASVAILILMYVVFDKQNSELIAENNNYKKESNLLNDSLFAEKQLTQEYKSQIVQLEESLKKKSGEDLPKQSNAIRATFFAYLTYQDMQTRGGNDDALWFTAPDRNAPLNPTNVTVEWRPISKRGDIKVYINNEINRKTLLSEYSVSNYDLSLGYYSLKDLKSASIYFFEITTEEKTYQYPFDTK